MQTAPPLATFNPKALHYKDSSHSMAMDQTSPFGASINDVASNQPFDDGLDWLTGFDHQISFHTREKVVDGSSPPAISTTGQSAISDVMLDGSNHPAPVGTGTMWQPSVVGPRRCRTRLRWR